VGVICMDPVARMMAARALEGVTIFYVGPSLYGVAVEKRSGEIWRGPARQGDILRDVLTLSPRAIVLIDGVFHQSLAVWHKEIVFALLEGVICIGAASMGALRAAEMHRYGMIGVGKIFEMYRYGEEDDSLVAMTFDPHSFRPLREAPVGQDQKVADALEAVNFARSYRGAPCTTLKKDAITQYMRVVLDRILN
jgi:hypothetical protein